MNFSIILDWKLAVAFGATAAIVIFAVKMNADDAKEVSIHAIDAFKEFEVTKRELANS